VIVPFQIDRGMVARYPPPTVYTPAFKVSQGHEQRRFHDTEHP